MSPRTIRHGTPKVAERAAFPVVCIGASAGGLEAFSRLLEHLPRDTGMGFVIIQHLDPSHPSVLPPLLGKKSALPVEEAREGTRVQANRVYVIPPDRIMTISRGILRLMARSSEKRYMPIDFFMRSLADDSGDRAVGVVLSGNASDGTIGLKAIKAKGGLTFAQDEKTAAYPGMPASAIASGCVDYVMSPENIAEELVKVSRHPEGPQEGSTDPDSFGVPGTAAQFARIFEMLRKVTGLDFSSYKRTTIRRRIARRMMLHKFSTLEKYLRQLQKNRSEVESLSQDLLIKVTTFFRDSEAFDALKKKVFPSLLRHYKAGDMIRVWVPGCSTGEEVYSIGICLLEAIGDAAPGVQCQIFATDISEAAIDRARSGFFTEGIKENVSPQRLRRFFVKTAEGSRIAKSVRDMCIFARQDLTKDPPFSKLDLISCRNVLIYMGTDLQKRILPIFHYALKPGGYLMLGSAESTGPFGNLFSLADKKGKIYSKKSTSPGAVRLEYPERSLATPPLPRDRKTKADIPSTEVALFREADKITLTRFSPPGVLLNDELEILQFRGHTGPYLEQAPGKPTVSILKLVKEGMVFELRAATEKATKQGVPVRSQPIPVRHNGRVREVVIEVVPIPSSLSEKPFLLVLFNELSVTRVKAGKAAAPISKRAEARLVQQLRRELRTVREELQSVYEEQEAAQEEFKSANEEILSSNEELQSTNEELETAKEELQSANEELTTLNEELLTRNSELGQLNGDITNLLASINIPILMLTQDLRIRRFTPVAGALLNLIPSDTGRPITDINANIDLPNLDRMVAEVIDTMSVREQEICAKDGRWYSLRIRPYRTLENKIEGATVTFVDIDAFKKNQRADAIYDTLREPVLVLNSEMLVLSANRSFYRLFGLEKSAVLNRTLYELGDGRLDSQALRTLLEDVLPQRLSVDEFRLEIGADGAGARTLVLNARRIKGDRDRDDIVLLAMEDVTDRKKS